MEEVYRFIKESVDSHTNYVVVGVSGGSDSMALLDILTKALPENCQIICAHVHHNLRKESDSEQIFVKEYCLEHNILFETIKLEYEKSFSEAIAREKRYAFFEKVLKKYQSNILFTAHHGDDLVETILMKITRGTTLKGSAGICLKSRREFYTIVRPLLYLNKKDILDYVSKYHIPYVEDASNQDSSYTRNRYRKKILPFLKQENPYVHRHFLQYSEDLQEMLEWVEKEVEKRYNKTVVDKKLKWQEYLKLDSFFRMEILKKYLFSIYGEDIILFSKKHLCLIDSFLKKGKVNSSIDLPLQKILRKSYHYVEIAKQENRPTYHYRLEDEVNLPNGHTIQIVEDSNDTSNFVTYIDSSTVVLPLYVRNVENGDKMTIKNMVGHKKISDIFTNEKILIADRVSWPVVVDSTGTIIWLPGLKKTQFDRKKQGKYDIILKYY